YPLASTAVPQSGTNAYGEVPAAAIPAGADRSQFGDGYSWIVQIIGSMELSTLYDKIAASAAPRLGNLRDAAFENITAPSPPVLLPGATTAVQAWNSP